jgi:Peptidase family M1 domain
VRPLCILWLALQTACLCRAADQPTAAALDAAVAQMSPDPEQTFRVRELEIVRSDVKIYLTEGVLSFLTPVNGKTVAAVFSTEPAEAGDAEIIVLPPQRNERAAMAAFTKSPNLDEHFGSALFFFTDGTAQEILAAIQQRPVHKMPEVGVQFEAAVRGLVSGIGADIRARLVTGLLDQHQPEQGFFFAVIGGKTLGRFDLVYNPTEFEQVVIGRGSPVESGASSFQLWCSFRSRSSGPYKPPPPSTADYRISVDIHADLSITASAAFKWRAGALGGRVIPLFIADTLQVESATVDDHAAEVLQPPSVATGQFNRTSALYLIAPEAVSAGSEHEIKVRYNGSVIRRTAAGAYFVDDRNAWYPFTRPTLATFDLTFRCPDHLQLVSTGDLISEEAKDGIRTVHRVTSVPEALAGFNLGEYRVNAENHGRYRIECYSNQAARAEMADIPAQTAMLLDFYTRRWVPLPIHSIAISPIPASFGQGFPGLIYLSDVSYLRAEDRPERLRAPVYKEFFSDLLLPHEVAHQWWGNMVTTAEYRSAWIMEALANYSALQFLESNQGKRSTDSILNEYRTKLSADWHGKDVDSYGPLEFGTRLIDTSGAEVWHVITYEKGTWVLHMLRNRLGDEAFLKLQLRILHDFANRPLTNEGLRQAASAFVPAEQPDKNLTSFFDSWIYGTGIPRLDLKAGELTVSGVADDFTVDLPLRCHSKGGATRVRWTRVSSGTNSLEWPAGTACELPAPDEFLYLPAR